MKSLTWRRRGVESMLIALFGNRGRALLGQGRRRLGRGGRLKGGCSKGSEAVVGWVGVELGRGLHKALIFTRLSQDFDKVSTKGWTPCHVAAYLIRDPRAWSRIEVIRQLLPYMDMLQLTSSATPATR